MKQFAKRMRQQPTDAESLFWLLLRDRRMQGFKFRRQVTLGPYIVDYLCCEKKLIIELDGGQHNETKQQQYDAKRTQWLTNQGYRLIRFWNHEVFKNKLGVLEEILRCLKND